MSPAPRIPNKTFGEVTGARIMKAERLGGFVRAVSGNPKHGSLGKTGIGLGIVLTALLWLLAPPAAAQVERVWLTHRSHDPSRLTVNWTTSQPGDSTVHYGRTRQYDRQVHRDGQRTLHHVEIPLPEGDITYHYSVCTGTHRSADATFKGYPTDGLRVAVVADWQRKPDLAALIADDVHLLVTAGDNIANLWQRCGAGNKDCITPYAELIDRYPKLFRSIPFLPVLGNHDKEIRPRGPEPPAEPVYDVDATAYRQFFELPDEEWKWYFQIPELDARFVALDLNHISDFGTTWQACHAFDEGSEQFRWYRQLMSGPSPRFVITLYNERSASIRGKAAGQWHELFRKGTIAITGFGYFAERAEVDGFTYYNTSLSGKGDRYPDPHSKFLVSEDSYLLLTFRRQPPALFVAIKRLDGKLLDRKRFVPRDESR